MPGSTTDLGPLVAEDLLLLLFDRRSGTFAGEGTLYYALAGAVLADLALRGHADAADRPGWTGRKVHATGSRPDDELLRRVWDGLSERPQGAQSVLARYGPALREPLVERLVAAGHLRRERRRVLGLLPVSHLVEADGARRARLVADVRAVLVDGATPYPRTGVLAALLSASGSLVTLSREIPWSTAVITRAKALEAGSWGPAATGTAVLRTTAAISHASAVSALAAVQSR